MAVILTEFVKSIHTTQRHRIPRYNISESESFAKYTTVNINFLLYKFIQMWRCSQMIECVILVDCLVDTGTLYPDAWGKDIRLSVRYQTIITCQETVSVGFEVCFRLRRRRQQLHTHSSARPSLDTLPDVVCLTAHCVAS